MNRLVRRKLQDARRFLIFETAWTALGWWFAAGLLAALVWRVVDFRQPLAVHWFAVAVTLGAICLVGAAVTGLLRWRRLSAVAEIADFRTQTRDRFVTALRLPSDSALAGPLAREIESYAGRWEPASVLRWGMSWKCAWLAVPLLALTAWEGWRWHTLQQNAEERAYAQELVSQAAQAAARSAQTDPRLEAAQELLEDAHKKLERSRDPLRDALRALDQAARNAEKSTAGLSPEETQALAEALAKRDAEGAQQLLNGQFAEAAATMEAMDPAALAEALQEAAQHRELNRLQELAQQALEQMQEQLGSLTQQTAGSESSGSRQQFLSALQRIKDRNLSGESLSESPSADPLAALGENGQGSQPAAPADTDDAPPGGSPGTEKDLGRGKDLAGAEADTGIKTSQDDFLTGQLADGPALVQKMRSSSPDDSEAKRALRQSFETTAAAALDAIERESIPPGSRLVVRRYFEGIRPAK